MQVSVLDFCSCLAVLFCFQLDSIVEKQHELILSKYAPQTNTIALLSHNKDA